MGKSNGDTEREGGRGMQGVEAREGKRHTLWELVLVGLELLLKLTQFVCVFVE